MQTILFGLQWVGVNFHASLGPKCTNIDISRALAESLVPCLVSHIMRVADLHWKTTLVISQIKFLQMILHSREDDATLSVRCVPKSVYLDSRKVSRISQNEKKRTEPSLNTNKTFGHTFAQVPDPSRAPMLRRLYRK